MERNMHYNPEMMLALYKAHSEDLRRRPKSVKGRRRGLVPRIAVRRNAPVFRSRIRSILSATVRSP
jgi:hypothetical protein